MNGASLLTSPEYQELKALVAQLNALLRVIEARYQAEAAAAASGRPPARTLSRLT